MKLTPKHHPMPGHNGEAYVARVKKGRKKLEQAKKTKKQQRRIRKGK